MAGYVEPLQVVFDRWPPSDTSKPARYARAMAYSRKPDLPKALDEINSLIKDEPNNPYFYEVLGPDLREHGQARSGRRGFPAERRSPARRAPSSASASPPPSLRPRSRAWQQPALANLRISLQQEDDDTFAWYEAAQAYSVLGNEPMANLGDRRTLLLRRRFHAGGAIRRARAPWPRPGLAPIGSAPTISFPSPCRRPPASADSRRTDHS